MPAKMSVDRIPTLLCAGVVASIDPMKVSRNGNWAMLKVSIDPVGPGLRAKHYLLYRPEYFLPASEFNPDSEVVGGDRFVYNKNVGFPPTRFAKVGKHSVSALEAFLGGAEAVKASDEDLRNTLAGNINAETVGEFLRDRIANAGVTFGYVMSQVAEKTGEIGDDGKEKRILTEDMELAEFFNLTKAARRTIEGKLKYAVDQAEKLKSTNPRAIPMLECAFDLDLMVG